MKKYVSLLLASIMVFALAACGNGTGSSAPAPAAPLASSAPAASESGAALKTLKDGVLLVGMQVDYPPFEQYAADGITPVGYDCDIIEAIADDIGLKVEYMDTAWDGIFAGLDTEKYDCIISGVTITDERKAKYDFTQSYIQNFQCMVTLKDSNVAAKSPEELTGLKVGYQSETTSDIYVTDLIDKGLKAEPFEYEKILECFSDLAAGRIDAVVCDSTVTYPYLHKENTPYQLVWQQDSNPEEFGIMVKKGDTALQTALDEGLTKLKSEGALEGFMAKWFSE